eukprot:Rmarinus@m.18753
MSSDECPYILPTVVCEFMSGLIAGAASLCVGHPFDTVKVQMQANPGHHRGVLDCVINVGKRRGLRGYFDGLLSSVSSIGIVNATLFASDGFMKRVLGQGKELSMMQTFVAANFAGLWLQLSLPRST